MIENAKIGDLEAVMELQKGFRRDTGRHIIVKCDNDNVEIFEKLKRGKEKRIWTESTSGDSLQEVLTT
jgi:hypothetical protein